MVSPKLTWINFVLAFWQSACTTVAPDQLYVGNTRFMAAMQVAYSMNLLLLEEQSPPVFSLIDC